MKRRATDIYVDVVGEVFGELAVTEYDEDQMREAIDDWHSAYAESNERQALIKLAAVAIIRAHEVKK